MFQDVVWRRGDGYGNFFKNKEIPKSELPNGESRLSGNAGAGVLRVPLQMIVEEAARVTAFKVLWRPLGLRNTLHLTQRRIV